MLFRSLSVLATEGACCAIGCAVEVAGVAVWADAPKVRAMLTVATRSERSLCIVQVWQKVTGRIVAQSFFPNSSPKTCARACAALMASWNKASTWADCIAVMAAWVVPPLEVTRSRRRETGSCALCANWLAPTKVPMASCLACSAGMPISMAAFSIASIKKKTYAGPEPDTAVTASNCASSLTHKN